MTDDARWTVATGEIDDKPLILRIRNEAPAFASQAEFPRFIVVQWEYQAVNENGMPSSEVAEHMSQLEDLLDAALEGASYAFLAVITTGNGVREWQWYARDSDETMGSVNGALAGHERFPVQFIMDDDPDWERYESFRSLTAA